MTGENYGKRMLLLLRTDEEKEDGQGQSLQKGEEAGKEEIQEIKLANHPASKNSGGGGDVRV
jgi:hypothetical protein